MSLSTLLGSFLKPRHLEAITMSHDPYQKTFIMLCKSLIYGSILAPLIHVIHSLYMMDEHTTNLTTIEYIGFTVKYFYISLGIAFHLYSIIPPFYIIPVFFIFLICLTVFFIEKFKISWGTPILTVIIILMQLVIYESSNFMM